MKHIVLTANTAWYLFNFRISLIRQLIDSDYLVTIIAPPDLYSARLSKLGCELIDLPMDNKGTNPVRDFLTLIHLKRIYRAIEPSVVLHFTVKPVIYGSMAASGLNIPSINTITGLGSALLKKGWVSLIVEHLYRRALPHSAKVFFQNTEDMALFCERKLVSEQKAAILPGSGVNLSHYAETPYPKREESVFILISRLLWDKGIGEYVEAAKRLKSVMPEVRFQLLGPLGVENPTAIPAESVNRWKERGMIEYLGDTDDVRPYIANADCVVLPSYREGTSRVLLEAAAMGRPIIATDVPGCREVVDDGINGWLCRSKDADALHEKMEHFMTLSRETRRKAGLAGRAKVEREFDEKIVIARYIEAIEQFCG